MSSRNKAIKLDCHGLRPRNDTRFLSLRAIAKQSQEGNSYTIKILFVLLFLINVVNLNNAECAIFGANLPITSASSNEINPKIAIRSDRIWMIWEDNRSSGEGPLVSMTVSYDGGENFNEFFPGNQDADSSPNFRINPSIAIASNGSNYYTWADDRNTSSNDRYDIYMNQTLADASTITWTNDIKVSDSISSLADIQTSIASSNVNNIDYAYIVWNDDRNGNFDIFFDQYSNATMSLLTADQKVNDGTGSKGQDQPRIAVREIGYTTTHEIFIVWRDARNQTGTRLSDIYFTKGTDDDSDGKIETTEFDTNVQVNESLSTSGIYYTAEQPDIAVDNSGNAYVVWRDNRNGTNNYDIYFTRKVSTATSFGTNYKVNDDTGTADQSSPAIVVDKLTGYIYVAWSDERDSDRNIYYSTSTDGGITWSRNVRVDTQDTAGINSTGTQDSPDIALDSNRNVYIVWEDARNGAYDIYFAKQLSQDDGTSPQAPTGLTPTSSPTKVDLSWNANTEADLAGYNLLRSSTRGGPYTKINGDPIEVLIYSDSGLVGTYYYVLEAVDIAGNHSPFSSEITANPTFESPGSGGGGCFIATAAFGSPLSDEVRVLSQMRDRYLLQSAIGRRLVGFYYKKGPAIADYISDKEYVKGIVRAILKPLVKVCQKVL